MLAPVVAAVTFLTAAGFVAAACQNDAACQSLGCKDQFQVFFGNTEIVEPRTTQPPYALNGFPGATTVGAQDVGGGTTSVTWRASEPTTLVIPKSTSAANGNPGTTFFVATSTFKYNGIKYEKPYVTSTTSSSYTKTETTTKTEVSVSVSVSTSTTTSTTTTTTTVNAIQTFCPPPPPCQHAVFNAWTTFTMTKTNNKVNPFTININAPGPATFTLADIDIKQESYALTMDGQPLGSTGAFVADRTYQANPDIALSSGWSWGKWAIPAGQHTIVVNGINFDTGFSTYRAAWKLEERCD